MHGHSLAQYPAAASFISLHHVAAVAAAPSFSICLPFPSQKRVSVKAQRCRKGQTTGRKHSYGASSNPPSPHLAASLKPSQTFELCFFLSFLPISQAFPGERQKKKKGMAASARTLMCGSVHARTPKLCAKLRVAPRSPPPPRQS